MERVLWDAVLTRLGAALGLCRELGLGHDVDRSRFITYQRVVAELIGALQTAGQAGARTAFNRHPELSLFALTESAEFADVMEFVQQYGATDVLRTLRRVLDGPDLPIDEDQHSNEGRNRLFELVVATKLWKAGLRPRLGDRPDLTCEVRGKLFYVECKRPLSKRGAQRSIGRARKMLSDELKPANGPALGVIALSLSKLLNPGDQLLVYRGEERGKEQLSRALEATAASVRSWEGLPSEIVGMLWHAITPAVDESLPLFTVAQFMTVHSLAPGYSLEEQWFKLLYDALARVWGHA